MPDSNGATLLEDLPEEIIDKILIRLPSKDIGRCRAVSTSWHSTTSTPRFMLEHHLHQPSLPIIKGTGYPPKMVVFREAGASASNQQLWPFLPGVKEGYKLSLSAACDGFIIVNKRYRFYICNPVIRKYALLPLPQNMYHHIIGFYRHHPTGEYRVLFVPGSWSQQFPIHSLHVLTVGCDEPRQVRVRLPIVSSPSVEQKLLKELRDYSCYPPPVHSCGSLHWCPRGATGVRDISDITEGGGDIIVFDTEAESFRWMRSPTQSCHKRRLFNMNETLALWGSFTPIFTTMDVWVMQDYEAEIWAFKYRIDLQTVEASRQLYLTPLKKLWMIYKKTPLNSPIEEFIVMDVLNEHELLINYIENEKNRVLRCDSDGKFLGIVNLGNILHCVGLTHQRLQESIVPIPYHEMKDEDEESPFSIGRV
ncbi:unnamed protein product [Alopecurus aequalis]